MRIEPPLERYAGIYPTNSDANDGLAVWTKANRTIANTDIAGWYTLGFHHITRGRESHAWGFRNSAILFAFECLG
jgi:Cu2+-containing amine oxidase